ncbi:unnamed protein product [Periconia digitata]|uniref:Uncharacterized protein n=1 Tax=Periconia digitata TaxID=1303443 RepID=A0A9W4XFU7_9PLEO|nr:unnamed protein product [Periconia digitata]
MQASLPSSLSKCLHEATGLFTVTCFTLAVMHSAPAEYHRHYQSFAVSDSRCGVRWIQASLQGETWRVSFSGELGAASSLRQAEG